MTMRASLKTGCASKSLHYLSSFKVTKNMNLHQSIAGDDISDLTDALRGRKVLITGANGFIGGRLTERLLLECGAVPRVLLRDYSRAARLARFGLDKIEIALGSLSDPAALRRAGEGCSVVFHCAYDRGDLNSNKAGIKALIDSCIENKSRLVHVSTFAIYEPLQDGDLVEDATPVHSGVAYSETKLDVEDIVLDAVKSRNLDATVVMPTIVYGPYGKGWTLAPASQMKNGTVLLPEKGEGLCNAVYVDDVCQMLIRAAVVPQARGRRYFVSGELVTWGAFFQAYADAVGVPGPQLIESAELRRKTSNPITALRLLLGDPKSITRWGPVRALATKAKTKLTPSMKARAKEIYGTYKRFAPAPVYAPSAQQMALFSAKCNVRFDRAQNELGYRPAYDFHRGAQVTGAWLRWAMPSD
jgi:nucleoside-diphosphate-sugar epimerase